MSKIKIFIASNTELNPERLKMLQIINSFNKIFTGYDLEVVEWETDIESGNYKDKSIQDRINEELIACEIAIFLFYSKLGQYTLEEFNLALEKGKKIFVYFKTGFSPNSMLEITNFADLIKFKEGLREKGYILWNDFTNHDKLENLIKNDLALYFKNNKTETEVHEEKDQTDGLPEIPQSYKKWLTDICQYMDITKMQEKGKAVRISLPETYVDLYAYPPLEKNKMTHKQKNKKQKLDEDDRKPVSIKELISKHEYLLIKGQAGTGKTTLLKHVAYEIINERADKNLNEYLPLLILLRDLKKLLDDNKNNDLTLEKVIGEYFKADMERDVINPEIIKQYCKEKKVLFLLDGLDEVAEEYRDKVVNLFADARTKENGIKLVISGRPSGIEGAAINRLGDKCADVLALSDSQIEEFINKWFENVYDKSSVTGASNAKGLIASIKTHETIKELMVNPLMLTAICILYNDGKQLPDQRSDLYKKFIEHLLYSKFENPKNIYDFLKLLAFEMHNKDMKGADRTYAFDVMSKIFIKETGENEKSYRDRIESFFDEIEPKCGLLKLEAGQYKFWHLTFQEFLTAVYIVDNEKQYDKAIKPYWENDNFKEVIKLYLSLLSISNGQWAKDIIEEVIDNEPDNEKKTLLVTEALLDIHKDSRNPALVEKTRVHLINSFEKGYKSKKNLARAGVLLSRLGDTRNLKEFVAIEGGEYDLEGLGKKRIKPFEICKYPVTNAWYEEFINADGYKNKKYWDDEGWKFIKEGKIEYPGLWNNSDWNCKNFPVTGISFYEANAFCNWLSLTMKDGYNYRLPTEEEWQSAAAGKEKRVYPWGNDWDDKKCNCDEGEKIEKISSIGIFTNGATPEKAYDMAGNVWEWTDSYYNKGEKYRVLRGGSYFYDRYGCRCAYRLGSIPHGRDDGVGFRCARTVKKG